MSRYSSATVSRLDFSRDRETVAHYRFTICDTSATVPHVTENPRQLKYDFEISHADKSLVRVSGGDLPCPIQLRISRTADGRLVVTGLSIGDEESLSEITSQTLREIRLRDVMTELFFANLFDPFVDMVIEGVNEMATKGGFAEANAKGLDSGSLQAFARTYLTELARQPQRAMTATAKAHNISRATANRWAQECRRLGYLPSKPEKPKGDKGNG